MILDRKITEIRMTNRTGEISPLVYARAAGLLYLIVAVLGGFAFFLSQSLIVPGDVATTANNIMASESLFRLAIVSGLAAQTVQILLVLVLYKLLKPVNKSLALLMVIFSLVGVPIAMLNLLNQFAALLLLNGANYLTLFEPSQSHVQAMFFLDLYKHGINIAQIFGVFGSFPLVI